MAADRATTRWGGVAAETLRGSGGHHTTAVTLPRRNLAAAEPGEAIAPGNDPGHEDGKGGKPDGGSTNDLPPGTTSRYRRKHR